MTHTDTYDPKHTAILLSLCKWARLEAKLKTEGLHLNPNDIKETATRCCDLCVYYSQNCSRCPLPTCHDGREWKHEHRTIVDATREYNNDVIPKHLALKRILEAVVSMREKLNALYESTRKEGVNHETR